MQFEMRQRHIFLAILLFCGMACPAAFAEPQFPPSVERAMAALDAALDSRGEKLRASRIRVDSLAAELSSANLEYDEEAALLDALINEFRYRDVDSAWVYSERAIALARANGDSLRAMRLYINELNEMPLRGHVHEAIERMDSLSELPLDREMKRLFLKNARNAYLCITSVYSPHSLNKNYFARYVAMNDSLLAMTPEDMPEHKLYLGVHYLGSDRHSLAAATLTDYLETISLTDNLFGDAAANLALLQFQRDRMDLWLYFMALSARSDATLGRIDDDALRQISAYLYRKGDETRAYNYLFTSQQDIADSGALIRSVHIAGSFPMIVSAYRAQHERYVLVLFVMAACLVLICILIVIIMRNRTRDLKRLSGMKEKLAKANSVKETYIAEFLSLCSVYIDKLGEFNRTVSRKIAAGQIEDLYGMVKSGRFIEEQSKLFYEVFDNAFINIYPDFIANVNKLLLDDRQIVLTDPKKLSPELRILAFMRMGLEDSAHMARFLGLSLNTVYTYRNRLRSRAKNRDTFEQDIMNIGGVQ